jgi:hypothetical protein
MPISEFFTAEPGNEKVFRDLEYQILMQMAQVCVTIIDTMYHNNRHNYTE